MYLHISSYSICSGTKSQKAKKTIIIHYQRAFDFFQNSSVPFHQVIFDHSISCVLLIDEPNESYKNSKTFQRNTLYITPAKTNAPISQTSSECPKLTIQIYQMRDNKNLR